jgi:excisionase family DNA binding protein
MNILGTEKSTLPRQISSVREAADELGVSERTIYRMLRSGKLFRLKGRGRNVENVSDIFCQNDATSANRSVGNMSKMSDKHDIETWASVELLKTALQEKDAQIDRLIDHQREMNQTIQRLQEQMYELAHLVLSQNTASVQRTPEPSVLPEREKSLDWRRWLTLFRAPQAKNRDEK